LAEVRGLKAQLNSVPEVNEPQSLSHIRGFQNQIKNNLALATTHHKELKAGLMKYPSLANKDQTQELDKAISNLKWSFPANAQTTGYWVNREQAKSDVNQFEKQLKTAIDKANAFNSQGLDIKTDLG
jgi:hypothetical protein